MIDQINTVPVRPNFAKDKIIWTATNHGDYTVKTTYHTLTQTSSTHTNRAASTSYQNPTWLWRKLWKMQNAPKVRTFLWLLCHNALATRANLYQRHIIDNPLCILCNQKTPETLEHLFLLYTWTQHVWSHPHIDIHISPHGIQHIDAWIMEKVRRQNLLLGLETIANVLW